jgi:hypothetical protein
MARPKRMGAYNALDDLLPGPAWGPAPPDPDDEPAPSWRPRLEPVPDPPASSRPARGRRVGAGALDDLLPGPEVPEGRRVGGSARPRGAGRHLGVWNPLDGPPEAPAAPARPVPAPPAKVRVGFRLPAELVETARDAVAHLGGTADRTTLTALVERALRVELARLAITDNDGRPFPPRDP